jgi:hypothetical protein
VEKRLTERRKKKALAKLASTFKKLLASTFKKLLANFGEWLFPPLINIINISISQSVR